MRNAIIAITMVFVVIVGIFGLFRLVFHGSSSTNNSGQTTNQQKFSDNTSEVRFTTDGAIVALEDHRSIIITVNQSMREVEVQKGYEGEVVGARKFTNTPAAYKQFLIALENYEYTKENLKVSKDDNAACPSSLRYIYEAKYNSGDPLRSWSASCDKGRFAGKASQVRSLFQAQIPKYNEIVADTKLIP